MDRKRSRSLDGAYLFGILIALASSAPRAMAQSVRINGPLVQSGVGDVMSDYRLTPDGARILFRADQDADDVFELFSAPVDGAGPTLKLSALLPGGDVLEFDVGANGRVVYRADQDADERLELYSVPADGSALSVRVSAPLVLGGDVIGFALSDDGTRVVYRADQDLDDVIEVYGAPTDGSALPVKLHDPLPTGFGSPDAIHTWITPDGTTALFGVFMPFQSLEILFAAPSLGGAPPLELTTSGTPPPLAFTTQLVDLRFTADGAHALFRRVISDDENEPVSLHQVPVDGSTPAVDLSAPSLIGVDSYAALPDSSRVIYLEGFNNLAALYSVALDGTGRVRLDPLNTRPSGFRLAPDGTRVVFHAGAAASSGLWVVPSNGAQPAQLLRGGAFGTGFEIAPGSGAVTCLVADGTGFIGLELVPLAGGPGLLLNGPPLALRGVATTGQTLAFTPDGAQLLFRQDRASDDAFELFRAPTDASQPAQRISDALAGTRDVQSFLVTPDGARAAYLADRDFDETYELFSAAVAGGPAPVRLNEPLAAGPVVGDVLAFAASPDGARVLYRGDQDADGRFDLYSATSDSRGTPVCLTASFADGGQVFDFAFGAAGAHALFDHSSFQERLYAVPVSGATPPIVIDSGSTAYPLPYTTDAAETRVVFRKRRPIVNAYDVYSAPLDGSAPGVRLNPLLAGPQTVSEFALVSDEVVLYRADQNALGVIELYRVPLAGGASVKLSGPMAGDVRAFRATADGTWAVYLADQEVVDRIEIYCVPLDGSRPARKLNEPLGTANDVVDFALDPRSKRALWRASVAAGLQFELFSTPFEFPRAVRGAAPVPSPVRRLTPLAGPTRQVEDDYAIGSDGREVFFRADHLTENVIELFRVPLDGSTAPTRVNAPMIPLGDVRDFAVTGDGAFAVFSADARTDQAIELFAAPLAGGPELLLAAFPPQGDVTSFRLAADSGWAVYRGNHVGNAQELFAVPVDGSAATVRLSRTLPFGGAVQTDFVALSGGRGLYRADQEANDVFELFLGLPERPPLPASTPTRTVVR